MQFTFVNHSQSALPIKRFLSGQGISHRLYNQLKQLPQNFVVNDQLVSAEQLVQPQDQVKITLPVEADDPQVATSNQPLNILFEDQNWLVLDKPAYLASVPGPNNPTDTVVNRVKGHLKQEHSANLVPHIITRLDRDTQGLMLIAKHRLANSWANQQLTQRSLKKFYYALVAGDIKEKHGLIEQPIGRLPQQIAHQVLPTGQMAKTEFWVLQHFLQATLVKVQLHTGRTHQIRVHFAYLGHPLIGDHLYGGPMDLGFKHQALQAYYLEFMDDFAQQKRQFQLPERLVQGYSN